MSERDAHNNDDRACDRIDRLVSAAMPDRSTAPRGDIAASCAPADDVGTVSFDETFAAELGPASERRDDDRDGRRTLLPSAAVRSLDFVDVGQ